MDMLSGVWEFLNQILPAPKLIRMMIVGVSRILLVRLHEYRRRIGIIIKLRRT